MREPRLLQEADGGRALRRRVRSPGRAVVDASVRGERFRLTLRAGRYEYPDVHSGTDANWVSGDMELDVRGFTARRPASFFTVELEAFRDALRVLDEKLTGEAQLVHLEEEFRLTIALDHGNGSLSGFVREPVHTELRFEQIEIDQTYVKEALREFEGLVEVFPVRGEPWA